MYAHLGSLVAEPCPAGQTRVYDYSVDDSGKCVAATIAPAPTVPPSAGGHFSTVPVWVWIIGGLSVLLLVKK